MGHHRLVRAFTSFLVCGVLVLGVHCQAVLAQTGNVLVDQGAADAYAGKLKRLEGKAASFPGTQFVPSDTLSPGDIRSTVVNWSAFPRQRTNVSPGAVDRQRLQFQEEYVEWQIKKQGDRISEISFTSQFPEYFESLADVSYDALVSGIQAAIPDANPTPQELLGRRQPPSPLSVDGVVGPATWRMLDQVAGFPQRRHPVLRQGARGQAVRELQWRLQLIGVLDGPIDGDFGPMTDRAVKAAQKQYVGAGLDFRNHLARNPWNNGKKGILALNQRFNTFPLLYELMAHCSVPRSQVPATSVCGLRDVNCVSGRSSDPNVCTAAQSHARNGGTIGLASPPGVKLLSLAGIWKLNGEPIDINDAQANQGTWIVSDDARRGTLVNQAGLTLDGAPITTGAQVAKKLQVGAEVLLATNNN